MSHPTATFHPGPSTLPAATSQLIDSTQPAIAGHMSEGLDESSVPGLDQVDSLAEYLVELRNKTSEQPGGEQHCCCVAEPAGVRQAEGGICCKAPR
ncbi:hypothetical protein AMECASPLE_031764 [Ameca splendens]|uniref:Uncharacterized protein n=1 Tax=Ameca splendens TaxID=208324 RepID=A0ABV1ADN6_9TELE